MKPYEQEGQKIRITTLKVEYKVIPFSDTLWKTVLKKWRDILKIEEVVLTAEEQQHRDTFKTVKINAYVDSELIEYLGLYEVDKVVLEHIADYLEKHYKLDKNDAKVIVESIVRDTKNSARKFYVADIVKE